MKNRITGILLTIILCVCCVNQQVYAKETPDELKNLYAQSAVLMDADSGRILFGKNEEQIMPMASTTKIMTCILALENMQDGQIATVSDYAAGQPKVHLGMSSGEEYYVEDLLYSLMLESHNDSAVAIAEAIGGTVEGFAEMMNEKAREIGCCDTYFITPNGLDAEDENGVHATTATDLALIMRYCIQESPENEQFLSVTRESSYQFSDVSGKRSFSCNNHNAFLGMMEGALSGKTGFTNNAGYCYVGALKRDDRTFIVALLACGWPNNKTYKWKDTRKLMEYALANYEYRNVWREIDTASVSVENGFEKNNPFANELCVDTRIAEEEQNLEMLLHATEDVTVKTVCQDTLQAPVKEGEVVGNVYYMLNDNVIKTYTIITSEAVNERNPKDCMWIVCDNFFL